MPSEMNLPYTIRRLTYDERKGKSLWPNGARMAILFYTCPEEWQWDEHESLNPFGTYAVPGETVPSSSTRTAVQYGFNIGIPRVRDIARKHGIRITLGTTGNAAERHGPLLRQLVEEGHEVAAHGYSEGIPPVLLSREDQKIDIDKTIKAIADATGATPRGWWSPGAICNSDTIELLAERGMLFHGDLQDDELPYFVDCAAGSLIEIPYNMVRSINDYAMFIGTRRPFKDVLDYATSTFDAYYAQAAETPLLMIVGTHPFVIGRPECAPVLDELIAHVKSRDDVWIATYSEVAEWWRSQQFGSLA